jgi:hypothetical protein
MKKTILTLCLLFLTVGLSGCSEVKEEIIETVNQMREYEQFLEYHNEVIDEYNEYIDRYAVIFLEEDLIVMVKNMENESVPTLDEVIGLSKEKEYKSKIYNELVKERTNAMLKTKEGLIKFIELYKDPEFTQEEQHKIRLIMKESDTMMVEYEKHFEEVEKSLE